MRIDALSIALCSGLWALSSASTLYVAFIFFFKDPAVLPLLGSMLSTPSLVDKSAPLAILAIFGWALLEIAIRALGVWRQRYDVQLFEAALATHNLRAQTARIDSLRAAKRTNLIARTPDDSESLHQSLAAAAALDASRLAASYSWLHAYAWLLPVLGFIGTAHGMASSIAGFKDALVETDRIDILVNRLSQLVIPGLASAFQTTMLALAASLVVYLCTSAVQSADLRTLQRLDDLSLQYISGVSSTHTQVVQLLDSIYGQLQATTAGTEALVATAERMQSATQRIESATNALDQAARTLQAASDELRASVSLPYQVTITRGEAPSIITRGQAPLTIARGSEKT
jgi:biopolymer transport protein ExbB/TolQ